MENWDEQKETKFVVVGWDFDKENLLFTIP